MLMEVKHENFNKTKLTSNWQSSWQSFWILCRLRSWATTFWNYSEPCLVTTTGFVQCWSDHDVAAEKDDDGPVSARRRRLAVDSVWRWTLSLKKRSAVLLLLAMNGNWCEIVWRNSKFKSPLLPLKRICNLQMNFTELQNGIWPHWSERKSWNWKEPENFTSDLWQWI